MDPIGEAGVPETGVPEGGVPEGGVRRRRWWRLGLGLAVGLPLLVFGLSNAWLATPPGRAWVGGVFQRLTGLESRVGPCSWSPWGGVTLRRIELLAPEALRGAMAGPMVVVERVRVEPFWRPLGRGLLVVRSLEVEGPRVVLPVELLSHLASRSPAVVVPVPEGGGAVAAVPGAGGVPGSGLEGGVGAVPEAPAAGQGGGGKPPAVAVAPDPRPTVWLRVRGGSFWCGEVATKREWWSVSGVEVDLPIGGQAACGRVVAAGWGLGGREMGGVEVPVEWAQPMLTVGPWRPEWDGIRCELTGRVIPAGPVPFLVDWKIPAQAVGRRGWGAGVEAGAGQFAAEARAGGYLRVPATWQGELRAHGMGLAGAVPGHEFGFDEGLLWLVVRNGILTVRDARAVGERLSLLGNALVLSDGRLACNGRLVVPQETAMAMQQRFGDILPPAGPGLRPLETPDRWVLDARMGGTVAEAWVEFGEGPTLRVRRLLEEMAARRAGD